MQFEHISMGISFEELSLEENMELIRCVTKLGKHCEKIQEIFQGEIIINVGHSIIILIKTYTMTKNIRKRGSIQ